MTSAGMTSPCLTTLAPLVGCFFTYGLGERDGRADGGEGYRPAKSEHNAQPPYLGMVRTGRGSNFYSSIAYETL
jgi:hypothetical protein